jgi:hypothetical protein
LKKEHVRQTYRDLPEAIRHIASIVNAEPYFSVTLDTGTASTVVTNDIVGINSVMAFMPITQNAARTTMWITSKGKRVFTINHPALCEELIHNVDSFDVKVGSVVSGSAANTLTENGIYCTIEEVASQPTGFLLEQRFVNVSIPAYLNFIGRYQGAGGHEVEAQIFDYSASVSVVTHGGSAYTCFRDHTASAGAEPAVGADWDNYWEQTGSSSISWAATTVYSDGFDDIVASVADLPTSTTDYVKEFLIPGTTEDRKKYVNSGNVRTRFIHMTQGAAAHHLYVDKLTLSDECDLSGEGDRTFEYSVHG